MAGTICQYYYTFGYLTMAGLAFLLNDSWQVVVIHHLIFNILKDDLIMILLYDHDDYIIRIDHNHCYQFSMMITMMLIAMSKP